MARIAKVRPKSGKIKEVINKRGEKKFYVRIRLKGAPVQCAVFSSITKAEEWIQDTESSIRNGRYFKYVEAKKHTFGELIDRYIRDVLPNKPKSFPKQKTQLLWWKAQLGHRYLSEVVQSPALISEKRDLLGNERLGNGQKRSPSTVIRYLAALSHVFSVAMRDWGWLDDNPMRKIPKPKEPRGRVRFLFPDERMRLLEVCKRSSSPFLYTIVVLALSTGMRYSEIMNLTWKDVDFERERITLEETKNGERRLVPLVGPAFDLLSDLSKIRRLDTFLLFPSVRDPYRPVLIRAAWEKALAEAAIEDFRFHDLRHSFGSEVAMNKGTDRDLQELLGHKSVVMTARYSHLREDYNLEVVRSMTNKIFMTDVSSQERG